MGDIVENIFAGCVLVAVGAAIVWPSRSKEKIEGDPRRPPPEPYRLKFPETYACVKKTLQHLYDPPAGWRIREEDRMRGEIRAYIELSFEVEEENGRMREVRYGITLDAAMTTQDDGATDVVLNYRGAGSTVQQQESLELTMRDTTKALQKALSELEVMRHG